MAHVNKQLPCPECVEVGITKTRCCETHLGRHRNSHGVRGGYVYVSKKVVKDIPSSLPIPESMKDILSADREVGKALIKAFRQARIDVPMAYELVRKMHVQVETIAKSLRGVVEDNKRLDKELDRLETENERLKGRVADWRQRVSTYKQSTLVVPLRDLLTIEEQAQLQRILHSEGGGQ